ncbi:c-type cytochrome [Aestuariirhabdus sp. LZHN29]|uniref:c-type cytochrome n=1 Tax=Aestuariirhabdus sp. LZHN29 TaxID=3417462 RepID=UPI003CF1D5A3
MKYPLPFLLTTIFGCLGVSQPLLAANSHTTDSMDGHDIYQNYCSVCHGEKGNGQSRATGGLAVPPRDFTSLASAQELSRERMIFSVSYGRPNTPMTSWINRLGQERIEVVVDHIRSTFMPLDQLPQAATNAAPVTETPDEKDSKVADMSLEMPMGLEGKTAWGETFYNSTCANCHGTEGDGNGPRSTFIFPKPRDFHHPAAQQTLNRPELFKLISQGSHGSEMPAWDKVLTYQEVAHVTEYVFSTFIRPEKQASD